MGTNSCFGLEGWIWVLMASVPDLCILSTLYAHIDMCCEYLLVLSGYFFSILNSFGTSIVQVVNSSGKCRKMPAPQILKKITEVANTDIYERN